jgi:hypothetical protein
MAHDRPQVDASVVLRPAAYARSDDCTFQASHLPQGSTTNKPPAPTSISDTIQRNTYLASVLDPCLIRFITGQSIGAAVQPRWQDIVPSGANKSRYPRLASHVYHQCIHGNSSQHDNHSSRTQMDRGSVVSIRTTLIQWQHNMASSHHRLHLAMTLPSPSYAPSLRSVTGSRL